MSERRERWRTWIDNQVRKGVLTMFLQRDAYTVSASRALALVALAATALAVSALLGARLLRTLGTDTIPAAVSPPRPPPGPGLAHGRRWLSSPRQRPTRPRLRPGRRTARR